MMERKDFSDPNPVSFRSKAAKAESHNFFFLEN